MSTEQNLTREEKTMTWCLGYLHELREKGLVDGPERMLTEDGWAEFISLKAEGFRPTDADMKECLDYLCNR